jgi:hypothetical protein
MRLQIALMVVMAIGTVVIAVTAVWDSYNGGEEDKEEDLEVGADFIEF